MRTIPTLALLALCSTHPALAQRRDLSECEQSQASRYACVLRGGGVDDLRDVELRHGDREIRFWIEGPGDPNQIMVIRQRSDSVSGRMLLIWSPGANDDEFVAERCGERWTSDAGMLCTGTFRMEPDWRKVVAILDSLRMDEMPSSPVAAEPCVLPSDGIDRLCAMVADGFGYWLEVATRNQYWRYAFEAVPDKNAPGLKRDTAILDVLKCVSRMRGEGLPCETVEARIR